MSLLLEPGRIDTKGVIWKYYADPDDPYLRDGMDRAGCRVLNPDPDFWENHVPVWAICGPWVRATLDVGDTLFFTPAVSGSRAALVPDYLCTGYLTVGGIVQDSQGLISDPRLTSRYKQNYKIDLRNHLRADSPRTAAKRPRRIILGNPSKSEWLGPAGTRLDEALREAFIRRIDLRVRRIRDLTGEEAARLRNTVSKHIHRP